MPVPLSVTTATAVAPVLSPSTATIRVAVDDEHELLRRGLSLLLDGEHDVQVVDGPADVVVLDLGLPDRDTFERIRAARRRDPRAALVVVAMEDDPRLAQCALLAGATAFVRTDHADTELAGAVRAAAGHP